VIITTKVEIELEKCDYCNYYENPNKEMKYESPKLKKCEICGKDICKEHTDNLIFEIEFEVGYHNRREIGLIVCKEEHRTDENLIKLAIKKLLEKKKENYSREW
jgi:hypothetical protein